MFIRVSDKPLVTRPLGMGAGRLGVNSRYFTVDGQPRLPVMGEIHFSRCPASEWRRELLKMRAGGVEIAATYVFWIHHEERPGEWAFSGSRLEPSASQRT